MMVASVIAPIRNEPIFDRFGNFTIRYHEFFNQSEVAIDDLTTEADDLELRMTALELRVTAVELRITLLEGTTVVTAVDVTTSGNQLIICTAALTVTLAAIPKDKDRVTVKTTAGTVVINGSGKNIDGDTMVTLRRNYIGWDMEYSAVADAWFVT